MMERKKMNTRSELNVEEFLLELRESLITNEDGTQADRVLYRMSEMPEYHVILMRAWCVWKMKDKNMSREEMALMLGSKAKKDMGHTSLLNHAMTMYKLIVVHKMWKLRFLCPTKAQLGTMLNSMTAFNKYFELHTDEFWQTKDDIPDNINEWIKQ
jgi:NADH:ubiquinone oxidoreductase subunit D